MIQCKMILGGVLLSLASVGHAQNKSDDAAPMGVGMNLFCDPVGSVYLGGTPLFNEMTGQKQSREEYLARKGLNFYCDPIGTAYAGGNPLFNPETGEMIRLETYLASKPQIAPAAAIAPAAIGLNLYCDPIDTAYQGGTPLFNEETGESQSRDEYLKNKGLNLYCDPIDTAYAGGNPLFDPEAGEMIALEDYLANKPQN